VAVESSHFQQPEPAEQMLDHYDHLLGRLKLQPMTADGVGGNSGDSDDDNDGEDAEDDDNDHDNSDDGDEATATTMIDDHRDKD